MVDGNKGKTSKKKPRKPSTYHAPLDPVKEPSYGSSKKNNWRNFAMGESVRGSVQSSFHSSRNSDSENDTEHYRKMRASTVHYRNAQSWKLKVKVFACVAALIFPISFLVAYFEMSHAREKTLTAEMYKLGFSGNIRWGNISLSFPIPFKASITKCDVKVELQVNKSIEEPLNWMHIADFDVEDFKTTKQGKKAEDATKVSIAPQAITLPPALAASIPPYVVECCDTWAQVQLSGSMRVKPDYLAPFTQTFTTGTAVWFHCEAPGSPTPVVTNTASTPKAALASPTAGMTAER